MKPSLKLDTCLHVEVLLFHDIHKSKHLLPLLQIMLKLSLHEASQECVLLMSMTQHIQETCGLSISKDPIILFEDNAACVSNKGRLRQKRQNKTHTPEVLLILPRARKE